MATAQQMTTATRPATLGVVKSPALPRSVVSAVTTDLEWSPTRALREIGPFAADIRRYSNEASRALTPVAPDWLQERLTALQVMKTSGWSEAKAEIWLTETVRLLADLPHDILADAIDEAARACKFLPDVAEIREIAQPRVADRRRVAARLHAMADIAERKPAPVPEPQVPEDQCSPEDAAAIIEQFGLRLASDRPVARPDRGPPRNPTADDIAEVMREMAKGR